MSRTEQSEAIRDCFHDLLSTEEELKQLKVKVMRQEEHLKRLILDTQFHPEFILQINRTNLRRVLSREA